MKVTENNYTIIDNIIKSIIQEDKLINSGSEYNNNKNNNLDGEKSRKGEATPENNIQTNNISKKLTFSSSKIKNRENKKNDDLGNTKGNQSKINTNNSITNLDDSIQSKQKNISKVKRNKDEYLEESQNE